MTLPDRRFRRSVPAAIAATLVVLLVASTTAVAAADFPRGYTGYHTYAEVGAAAKAVADAHPSIASRFSIGKSYQGRELWAMKISDNVGTDENEPEVLYDGGHHADEHMGVEMALRIMRWLVDGYGSDTRITNIVNGREIWIIFLVNPDGAEYDIANGRFHYWRKNRQPTPGTGYTGTDLNRNYGYRWGGGGRTSSNPAAITYRGPSAWSAPEVRAVRDFLASRVVDSKQQIRMHITFHEAGRLVMWPYGYTYADLPGDMTSADHHAFVHMGRQMARTNGYKPEQASDLYITSGTTRDYAYGVYRIFSYTFEMSNRDYMDDSLIASETGRNKAAVLYLAERAWCPYAVLGTSYVHWRCGSFDDDFEAARGWTTNPDGTDTATSGAFARGNPASTSASGAKQLGTVPSGSRAIDDRPARRFVGQRQRPRRVDDRAVGADPHVQHDRAAAVLPLRVRPRLEFVVGRPAGREHRNVGRGPDAGLHEGRGRDGRRRRLAEHLHPGRCLEGPDDPHRLRGGRRRVEQPPRGPARGRAHHARHLGDLDLAEDELLSR